MNLTKAFIVRKRLQELVSEEASKLSYRAPLVKEFSQIAEPKDQNREYDKSYNLFSTYLRALSDLNAAIDKANATSEARATIYELEGLKQQIKFARKAVQEQENFKPEVTEFDRNASNSVTNSLGAYVVKKYYFDSEINWDAEVKQTQKAIRKLEDKVAEINAATSVSISSDLEKFLEDQDIA